MNNTRKENSVARFTEKWQSLGWVYEEYAKSRGLTYMSFIVLEIIYTHPDRCTQKLICERTLYTKQSVNSIIKTFWKQGYVVLKEDETDRRNKKIILTDEGKKHADEIIGEYLSVEKEAMERLSSDQWEQLVGMVQIFAEHFTAGMTRLIQAAERK